MNWWTAAIVFLVVAFTVGVVVAINIAGEMIPARVPPDAPGRWNDLRDLLEQRSSAIVALIRM